MLNFLTAACCAAIVITPALAEDVATTVIAMERNALNRFDPAAFLEISDSDVVYQDPFLTKPLKGIAALKAYYATMPVEDPSPGLMQDATVQQFGDIAVLSFHYIAQINTKHQRQWNATEVYRKTKEGWRIVNTHWSLTQP